MEGNYRRALAGSTDDPWLHGFGEGVVALAERAERRRSGRTSYAAFGPSSPYVGAAPSASP